MLFLFFKGGFFMKRFAAVFLSAFFSISCSSFSFAEEQEAAFVDTASDVKLDEAAIPEKLEKAILAVKSKIDIPKEYSEFDYTIDTDYAAERYTLKWSKKNSDSEKYVSPIMITTDINGNIYYYYHYMDDEKDNSLENKKSREECLNAAQDFLKKVLPDNYSEFKHKDGNVGSTYFTFMQYKGNIPVRSNVISIEVDGQTLNINEYNFQNIHYMSKNFKSSEGIIEEKAAEDKFVQEVDFKPEYVLDFDYKTKEKKTFLAYNPERISSKSIDAESGNLFKRNDYISVYRDEATADSGGGYSKSEKENSLSKEELAEVDKSKNLISKEEADSEIRKLVPNMLKDTAVESANLTKNTIDSDKYIWSIQYSDGYANIDAKTKEIYDFYFRGNDIDEEITDTYIPDAEKREKAEQFIKKIAPQKFEAVEFSEEDSRTNSLKFVRKVNGFDFPENIISVDFGKDDNIVAYYSSWYDSLKFDEPGQIIDGKQAFEKLKESTGFGLVYEMTGDYDDNNKSIVLAYSLIDTDNKAPYISAATGEEINYDGSAYKREFNPSQGYPDISGHWCEKYVKTLLNNGIYVKRENFLPDENITKAELLDYYGEYRFKEEIRKAFKDNSDFISRKEMAAVIVKMIGYDRLSSRGDVFKNPFGDVSETDGDFGAMVICAALDIISADENGNFNPDRQVTNAEAAKIIYGIESIK